MENNSSNELFTFREVPAVSKRDKFPLLILVIAGVIAILQFADWWFRKDHIGNIALFLLLSLIVWYSILRILLIWFNYLGIKKPSHIAAKENLRVAIFTTSSPGEPLEMFEKTLAACAKINYPHTTYLLDDTRDPVFKACAERHGAVWLELIGLPGAKAGKVNRAIQLTTEDYILIMDPDHIPFPNFLDHTLGYFEDEKIGFVQVSQAYYNQYRSFTAKGAAEQTYTFYGPTQMSLYGYGCSVAIGANCTFRRKALESIGGHGIGLAEDLVTSIRLHAAGWKSIYNPVVVSRGLVPEDFGSFCKQQLKWARGVFEVVFEELPKLYKKLSVWQRISYFGIGTYYLVGVTSFILLLIPFLYFTTGVLPAKMSFVDFLLHGSIVGIIAVLIYLYMQRWMCHPKIEKGIHWRGMILKMACWPVFLMGFALSLVNAEIPYIPTAKKAVRGYFTPFAKPLVVHVSCFIITAILIFIYRKYSAPESELILTAEKTWGMMSFAFLSFSMSVGGIFAALEANRIKEEDPWENIDITTIKYKRK